MITDFLTDDDPLAQYSCVCATVREYTKYQKYRRHPMSQDQRGRDQVPIAALPPVFAHVDIAEHYQEGRFSSKLEAEITDILWYGQPVEEPEGGRPIALTDEAL